jgi:AraC-like DNA-binding protein
MDFNICFENRPVKALCCVCGKVGPVFHRNALEILLILDGGVSLTVGGKQISLRKGECAIINAGLFHTIEAKPPAKCLSVYIDLFQYQKKFERIRGIGFILQPQRCQNPEHASELRNYLIRLLGVHGRANSHARAISEKIADSVVKLLCTHFWDTEIYLKAPPNFTLRDAGRILQISAYLSQNALAADFSVQKLAGIFCLTPSRISHFWKIYINITLSDAVWLYRMNEAARLLVETDLPLGDVAESCGISRRATFFSKFKKCFNCTPSQFRVRTDAERRSDCYSRVDMKCVAESLLPEAGKLYAHCACGHSHIKDSQIRESEKNLSDVYGMLYGGDRNGFGVSAGYILLENGKSLLRDNEINWEYIYTLAYMNLSASVRVGLALHFHMRYLKDWIDIVGAVLRSFGKNLDAVHYGAAEILIFARDPEESAEAQGLADHIHNGFPGIAATVILLFG